MSELNLILLGPPGSGKGTQGESLQDDLRLPYYATGDILRTAIKEGTEIGAKAKEYMDRCDARLRPSAVNSGAIPWAHKPTVRISPSKPAWRVSAPRAPRPSSMSAASPGELS